MTAKNLEARNSALVLKAHVKMLSLAKTICGEELAARQLLGGGTWSSPEELRLSKTVFAVMAQGEWRYPVFQLDTNGKIIPEMAEVLRALGPDPRGWAYLQWFLEPNYEALQERTPLEVWEAQDRKSVIEAAKLTHWHARN